MDKPEAIDKRISPLQLRDCLAKMDSIDDESSSSSAASRLGDFIESSRSGLLHILDINYGLLNELYTSKVLAFEEIEKIRSKSCETDKVNHLLDIIVKLSLESKQKFVDALRKTQQSHVLAHIYLKGDIKHQWSLGTNDAANERLEYPLLFCSEFKHMDQNWCQLIELIDPANGLLDELLESGVINAEHLEDIESRVTRSTKTERLLHIVRRKSLADFHKFLKCLAMTKQHHIAYLLSPMSTRKVKPLTEEQKSRLRKNHSALVNLIDSRHSGLLGLMYASCCITLRQKEHIENAATRSESNKRLLDIVRCGSEADFNVFIDCLNRTKQQHVRRMLLDDGTVAQLAAKTNDDDSTRQSEQTLVEQFMGMLSGCSDDTMSRVMSLLNQYADIRLSCSPTNRGDDDDLASVELIAMTTTCSVGLYFMCKTFAGLQRLHALFSTGELKTIIERLFVELNATCAVLVNKIVWDSTDYDLCVHSLCAADGCLPLYAKIHRLASKVSKTLHHSETVDFQLDNLPHEIFELVLQKAASQLYIRFRLQTSRAIECSIVSLASVSSYWRRTLTCRAFIRYLLKKYFVRISRPYRANPKRASSSIVCEDSCVFGVSQLREKLYILSYGPEPIQVYSATDPYNRVGEVTASGLVAGVDIVACCRSSRLFVADYLGNCVWQIDVDEATGVHAMKRVVSSMHAPWSLSTNNGRLMVTLSYGDILYIYDESRQQKLDTIDMPDHILAQHATETRWGTIVVCHTTRRIKNANPPTAVYSGISELSADGSTVLRRYVTDDTEDLVKSMPYHVATDASGKILFVDRSTGQVVVLNSDLKMERLLIKLDASPRRMSFVEPNLSVCFFEVNCVNVYAVSDMPVLNAKC